jgi:hypothetical protein
MGEVLASHVSLAVSYARAMDAKAESVNRAGARVALAGPPGQQSQAPPSKILRLDSARPLPVPPPETFGRTESNIDDIKRQVSMPFYEMRWRH